MIYSAHIVVILAYIYTDLYTYTPRIALSFSMNIINMCFVYVYKFVVWNILKTTLQLLYSSIPMSNIFIYIMFMWLYNSL